MITGVWSLGALAATKRSGLLLPASEKSEAHHMPSRGRMGGELRSSIVCGPIIVSLESDKKSGVTNLVAHGDGSRLPLSGRRDSAFGRCSDDLGWSLSQAYICTSRSVHVHEPLAFPFSSDRSQIKIHW